MTMKFFRVVLRRDGEDRILRVPSPTGVQVADAVAPSMRSGETILSIDEVEDDGLHHADVAPPMTQTEALAPVTPGAAAVEVRR